MRRSSSALVAALIAVTVGCSAGEGERVTVEQLTDLDQELPDDATGVELGPLAPSGDITFCEAAGQAPARWLTGALAPIQYWVDAFSAAVDAPREAESPIAELAEFGEDRLRWHLGRLEGRPEWTVALAEHAVDLFDIALAECDRLPMVINLDGASDRPAGWDGQTDAETAARCEDAAADLAEGVAWFTAHTGFPPRHQQQIELVNDLAWQRAIAESGSLPDDVPLFTVSDFVGLDPSGLPAPVPGGACDR